MPEKCLLCIELLLFLSLKMKLWHIRYSLDFCKHYMTRSLEVEQLSCSAASSTCALQRSPRTAGTGQLQLDPLTHLPLRPLAATWVAVSQGCAASGSRTQLPGLLAQDKLLLEKTRSTQLMLCFSSVILTGRIWSYFLNMGICLENRSLTAIVT